MLVEMYPQQVLLDSTEKLHNVMLFESDSSFWVKGTSVQVTVVLVVVVGQLPQFDDRMV